MANTLGTSGVVKDQISLKEMILHIGVWYQYLLGRKKQIFIVALAGVLFGLIYSLITPPVYNATTSFVLESNKKGLGDYSSIVARFGLGGSSGGGLFQDDENIMTFMKSRTVIAQTLYTPYHVLSGEKQLLVERYLEFSGLKKRWENDERLSKVRFHKYPEERSVLEDSIVTLVYKNIVDKNLYIGKPDKEESIIVATASFVDESFSKTFNEALISNVIDFYIKGQTKKSQENVDILQSQVDSIRQLLNAALSGIAYTTEANPNPNPALQRLKVPSQKKMVDVEMNKAILEELVKNLELSKIALRKETPLIQIIDKPVLPLEKKKTGKLEGGLWGFVIFFSVYIAFLSLQLFYKKAMKS